MVDTSLWMRQVERDPEHSRRFIQRFRDLAAAGKDVLGEARFVDAVAPRRALILDAGCGSGRIGGELARRGHRVVGVDVDPELIAAARTDYADVRWLVGDLAETSLASLGTTERFDVVVAAGNVMPFLAPGTRRAVLSNLRAVLAPSGRAAIGFGAGRGYAFADFTADLSATGWRIDARFRGWNLLPFAASAEFLVALVSPGPAVGGDARRRVAGATAAEATAAMRFGTADPMAGNTLPPLH